MLLSAQLTRANFNLRNMTGGLLILSSICDVSIHLYFSTYSPGPVVDAANKSDLVIVCLGTGTFITI